MKSIILIIISVNLLGCNNLKYPKEIIISKYENGEIRKKKIFSSKKDTINATLEVYYENGKIEKTGLAKDTIVYGVWKYYYENGNLKQVGEYEIDDSLNNGYWTYSYYKPIYDKFGNIDEPLLFCSYDYRKREKKNIHVCRVGNWVFYHDNGNIKAEGSFVNGWSNGEYKEYYENRQLKLQAYYDKGERIGKWLYYYQNGQLQKTVIYKDSIEQIIDFFLENGEQTLSNGAGYTLEKIDNDSIIKNYNNYLLHGKATEYTFNGYNYEIREEVNYDKGKNHGELKYYNNTGSNDKERLSTLRHFYQDELHGYDLHFYDGKITEKAYFIHGKEHGIAKWFDMNTRKITLIEPWIMGKRHGIRKYFDKDGVPELYQYFYDDEIVGRIEFEEGKIIETKIYEGDEKKFNELHNK